MTKILLLTTPGIELPHGHREITHAFHPHLVVNIFLSKKTV
jgi:hypothetical protein